MDADIRREPFDGAAARRLDEAVQSEYLRRYGGPDQTVLDASDFEPPAGAFYVAWLDDEPAASGGWRSHGVADAEMKRLYVVDAARGRGLARAMVSLLEKDAARAGKSRLVLVTGTSQPEALALYASMGYEPVKPFGPFAEQPKARHLGKQLIPDVDALNRTAAKP